MSRRTNAEMGVIENATKQLMTEGDVGGPQGLKDKLKERFSFDISKQTAQSLYDKYTPQVVSSINETDNGLEYEDNPEIIKINERIRKLEKDFDNATTASDRQKFNTALNDTQESKLKLKKILREADMLKRTSDKKTVIIKFGTPDVIQTDIVKKPFFKADEKQKTIPMEGDEL
jgi:uncharacterized UPF0160 family protein